MKAFEVYVNGEKVRTIGIEHDSSVSVRVSGTDMRARHSFSLSVGGNDWAAGESLGWPQHAIGVGDEVTVRVVEASEADPPVLRVRPKVEP